MKRFTLILSLLVAMVTTAMAQKAHQRVSHDGWVVTALNEAVTSGNEGGVAFIADDNASTFYHSNWSSNYTDGNGVNKGKDGLQAFMVELPTSLSDLSLITYKGRSDNNTSGWARGVRVYVFETLPTGWPEGGLSSLGYADKEALLASTNTNLGTAAFDNTAKLWANDRTQKLVEFATPQTGKYVLFIMESGSDAWLTCSDFQIYQLKDYAAIEAETPYFLQVTNAAATGTQYVDIKTPITSTSANTIGISTTTVEAYFEWNTTANAWNIKDDAGTYLAVSRWDANPGQVTAGNWQLFVNDDNTLSIFQGDYDGGSDNSRCFLGGDVTTDASVTKLYTDNAKDKAINVTLIDANAVIPVTVNYSFKYEGVEKYSASYSAFVGDAYPDYSLSLPFGVTAATKPAGNIEEASVVDGAVNADIALSVGELPFVAATENAEDIEHWYYMQMHWNNKKYVNTNGTAIKWVDTEITDANKDASTWGFVGNIWDGFKVVNYAALNEENNDNTTLTWNSSSSLGTFDSANEFGLVHTGWGDASAESFCLVISEGSYLNAQSGTVASWSSADAGSTFTLTERPMTLDAELTALIEAIEGEGITSGTNPGEYSATSVDALTAALATAKAVATATQEDVDALQAAYDALAINPIEEGMYMIVNAKPAFNNEKVLTAYGVCGWYQTASTPAWTQIDDNDPLQYWTIEKVDENYYIKAADGNYITSINSLGSEPAAATFDWKAAGQYNITIGGGVFHANLHGYGVSTSNIVAYGGDADSPSCWKLVKVAQHPEFTHTLSVGTAGWATLVLGFNATIPTTEGFKAYTIASQENGYVTLADATGVLGANVPVIVEATAGDYEFAYTTEPVTVTTSGLEGTLYPKNVTAEAYVLGIPEGETEACLAKAKLTDGAFLNNANKAYFVPTNTLANAASYSFRFGEGTTGVEKVEIGNEKSEIYDLTGRRVEEITEPGIYIVNGVKKLVR